MNKYVKLSFLFLLIGVTTNLSAQIYINGAKSITYDSANNRWLVAGFDSTCRIYTIQSNTSLSLYTSVYYINASSFFYNSLQERYIFFGANKYIESDHFSGGPNYTGVSPDNTSYIDSIKPAQQIKSIVFVNNNPALAIITNDSSNYLFKKENGEWSINEIIIDNIGDLNSNPSVKIALWIISFLLIACIVYCIIRLRRIYTSIQNAIIKPKENALLTKSEKPIGLKNQDLLGFDDLENAVVSIIKNPQTELPLSIVINGSWGSGKTSMMNRIKEKLEADKYKSERFITTWFNAWHLQGESSLLNTFLLNIIDAYEKDYSFVFRLKLAIKRFVRLPALKQIGFGFAVAVIAPIVFFIIANLIYQPERGEPGWIQSYCTSVQSVFSNIFTTSFNPQSLSAIAAIVFAVISYIFLNKQFLPSGLSAFFELIPKNNFRFDVEKAPAGYREKFKKDYWEIIDAGKQDKRLVVFIDDIDRIGGDKILELLEGINFISDIASRPAGTTSESPNTVFILGMYMGEVAKNLGAQLEKINGAENTDINKAVTLGNRYLEKMIQLIVPVPFDKQSVRINYLYENE